MDDEEYSYASLQEPLYRVETGNYEYRLVLRCRQLARKKFAKYRQDVLIKLELLDQKHVQDIVFQLHRFITAMSKYHTDCYESMKSMVSIFPIEVDLPANILEFSKKSKEIKSGHEFHDEIRSESESDDDDEEFNRFKSDNLVAENADTNLIDISND